MKGALGKKELLAVVPLSWSTIDRLERDGEFPKRWYITDKRCAWTQEEVEAWLAACGLRPLTIAHLPDARHIFSHVEWQMQGWAVELAAPVAMVAEGDDGFVWASPEELADAYSVPSAFQYFLHEHRG